MCFRVHCIFHVNHLGEKAKREGCLGFVGMDKGSLERAAMCLVFDNRLDGIIPIEVDQNGWDLIFLRKAMHGCWNNIFLPMTVEQDLFSEARVPKSRNDRTQVCCESFFIHRDRAGHSNVMIRMASKPDGLRHRASGLLCDRLGHASDQKSILAIAGMRTTRLRT